VIEPVGLLHGHPRPERQPFWPPSARLTCPGPPDTTPHHLIPDTPAPAPAGTAGAGLRSRGRANRPGVGRRSAEIRALLSTTRSTGLEPPRPCSAPPAYRRRATHRSYARNPPSRIRRASRPSRLRPGGCRWGRCRGGPCGARGRCRRPAQFTRPSRLAGCCSSTSGSGRCCGSADWSTGLRIRSG
jgi:hypothetical protein